MNTVYLKVHQTDRQTDGRTDGQTTLAPRYALGINFIKYIACTITNLYRA